ncbi:MAG: hypothetical protein RIT45_1686 [Pseudomonadota bacterium]
MAKVPEPPRGWDPSWDHLPDVRDGLTRIERLVLYEMHLAQEEFPGRTVPTALLYGRLTERGLRLTPEQFSRLLARLGARHDPWR